MGIPVSMLSQFRELYRRRVSGRWWYLRVRVSDLVKHGRPMIRAAVARYREQLVSRLGRFAIASIPEEVTVLGSGRQRRRP